MQSGSIPGGKDGRESTSIIQRLGIRPLIAAGGPNTKHSGTKPRPEVIQAMIEMSETFVQMDELLIAAGQEIADMIGVPAATVTSGASGGLVLQSAAAIAKDDPGGQRHVRPSQQDAAIEDELRPEFLPHELEGHGVHQGVQL